MWTLSDFVNSLRVVLCSQRGLVKTNFFLPKRVKRCTVYARIGYDANMSGSFVFSPEIPYFSLVPMMNQGNLASTAVYTLNFI